MNIIKVLEHMTDKDHGWTAKEIEAAVEKIRIHKENRERIATAILQAKITKGYISSDETLIRISVKLADVMIGELNK